MDVPIAAATLGIAGAVCWSVQLIPQIIINYRKHDTTGLQPVMMLLWATAGIPLGAYNIVQDFHIALKIQPQILTALSLTTWLQCQYYGSRWSWFKCLVLVTPLALVLAGVELGFVFALYAAKGRHLQWPMTLMAVLSASLLSAGVLRHYWDIYKERTVRGISFIFVAIDALGDLTSLVSIFFQPDLDVLGMVIYGSELVLWLGILGCGGYFNLRPWLGQKIAAVRVRHGPEVHSTRVIDEDNDDSPESTRQSLSSRSSSTVFQTASSARADHAGGSTPSLRLRTVPSLQDT
ncbi:hypothetical protein PFICI_01509 [Pestalotiopsis fici W106-1]|uniref:PQ loop repeat protein n=1 Tax=Pestalotiopsis fici (strain W106-1 / CGMCC3.15140) TaxID=1229662 RepID=W3XR27_PESFW|nr:uncharacterized protein PFICI_01509 [Pestalotiopsis fici W106-1]ETS87681.1 hypothetical protein PFICI_01509 [Pestalotiopsis fici W106-1]